MKESDEIDKLIEWQEHQNNPGYWVNHRAFFEPPKRSIGFYLISMIDVVLFVPVFIFSFVVFIKTRSRDLFLFMLSSGIISVLSILRAIRMRPPQVVGKSQTELDAMRRAEKKEKKAKHHNKPKNYH